MFNSKIKLLVIGLLFILGIFLLTTVVNAANENIQIVKNNKGEYMIYVKDNEGTNFEFAFSKNQNEDKASLSFKQAETDSQIKIAYVDSDSISLFEDNTPTYMWVKDGDNYILNGIEVDLSKAITDTNLQYAATITKIIGADSTKTSTTEKTEDGKKITTTVGEIVLENENGDYSYITIKLPNSEDYNNFMKLATKVSKLNSNTDMYTQIETYSEILNLFNSLKPDSEAGWLKADKNIIYQPEDAEDGEEYVVWIKDNNTDDIDVQFLTSTKKFSEEKIKETITTKLPVTYDNNTLLIVFAIVVVAIILVCVRIKYLNKKES